MATSPQRRAHANLHGHRVSYLQHGGAGVPLLMIHGVGSSIETWGDIPDRLSSAGLPFVALDLLGHGSSSMGHGDFSLGAHANTMRDLMDHLELDRVHLVGHSLGGGISLQFAYQYPDRVASLTLVSSGGLGPDVGASLRAATLPGADLALRTAGHPRVLGLAARTDRVLGQFGKQRPILSATARNRLESLRDQGRRTAFLATLRSVVGPEGQRVSAVSQLTTLDPRRVLIVWGELDLMVPIRHGRDAHDQLPGSKFVEIAGAGHHPHTDDEDAFTEVLVAHVAEISELAGAPRRSTTL
ncbi:MAG: alpha/beta fold hydrolase [Actinomycetes bacterium]